MSSSSKLNVYFPINNLNPQGWVSEFITPVLQRTGNRRSDEANLFYDKYLNKKNSQALQKLLTPDEYLEFLAARGSINEEKTCFLNGNYLDLLEVDSSYKGDALSEKELAEYISFMSTIKPYQAAYLQPYIKLQYGYRTNKKEEFKYIDFPFTQNFDLPFILSSGNPRSEGCGINSINVESQLNIATHINSNVTISFMFSSMKLLTQEINAERIPVEKKENIKTYPYGFSFMKLATNLDNSLEVIRLEYGKKASNELNNTVVGNSNIKDIIERKEKKVYLLGKTSHNFSFDEKGVITLQVNYLNFHDINMLSPNNVGVPSPTAENVQQLKLVRDYGNMFSSYKKLQSEVATLEEQLKNSKKQNEAKRVSKIESAQKDLDVKFLTEKLSKANKTMNLLKRSLKPGLATILLDKIKAQGQLFGVKFNTVKVNNQFNLKTSIFLVKPTDGNFIDVFNYEVKEDIEKLRKNAKIQEFIKANTDYNVDLLTRIFARIFNSPYDDKATNKTYGHIMFFPLKALISAGYSFLEAEEKTLIPDMLFGNVSMKINDRIFSINIGDLLVEAETFQKWYYKKFFKKDRLEYSFGAFMTDIITDLVPEALYRNRVGFDDKAPTSAVKQTQYYLKENIPQDLKRKLYLDYDKNDLRKLSSILDRNPASKPRPIIYYGQINNQSTQVTSPIFSNLGVSEFKFNEMQDAAKGIPHIKIGADGGIFTSVDFNAQDFSKIRTALAMEALADKASRYFFFYYQLNITMLGNNMFNYDSVVCVPSNPLGIDSEENDPGIAGYYKVKSLSDSLDANNSYTTTARADWAFNPRNNDREKDKPIAAPVADITITDYVDVSINDPQRYLIELLENNPDVIINSQLQKMQIPSDNPKEQAKKDAVEPQKTPKNIDLSEKLPTKTPNKNQG